MSFIHEYCDTKFYENGKLKSIHGDLYGYLHDISEPKSKLYKYYIEGFSDEVTLNLIITYFEPKTDLLKLITAEFPKRIEIKLGAPGGESENYHQNSTTIFAIALCLQLIQRFRILRNCTHLSILERYALSSINDANHYYLLYPQRIAANRAALNLASSIFGLKELKLNLMNVALLNTKLLSKITELYSTNINPTNIKYSKELQLLELNNINFNNAPDFSANKNLSQLLIRNCELPIVILTNLDKLKYLRINDSSLSELDISSNVDLTSIILHDCDNLNYIDIRNNINIQQLEIEAKMSVNYKGSGFKKIFIIKIHDNYDVGFTKDHENMINYFKKFNPNLVATYL